MAERPRDPMSFVLAGLRVTAYAPVGWADRKCERACDETVARIKAAIAKAEFPQGVRVVVED